MTDTRNERTQAEGRTKGKFPLSYSLAGEDRHLKFEASGFEIRIRSIGHLLNDPHTRTYCESNLSSMISGLTKCMQSSVILKIKASDGQQETYRAS
jgi:hypothetical protein